MTTQSFRPPLNASSTKHTLRRIPDTEEIAGYLLTLKHRPVTPDPHSNNDRSTSISSEASSLTSASSSSSHYETPLHRLPSESSLPLHDGSDMTTTSSSASLDSGVSTSGEISMALEPLIAESNLVDMPDRDLVPDCLFVAMAQMKACRLTRIDRVGCYKSREIGFIGMACKHCGGQPGFGRYFPNSVRSLAQTTTSQTILKHIGSKCTFVPKHIRDAILELQRLQVIREGFPTGRPRYGSRKVFFQRIWHRLHGEEINQALEAEAVLARSQPKTTFGIPTAPKPAIPSDTSVDASESLSSSSSLQSVDEEVVRATTTTTSTTTVPPTTTVHMTALATATTTSAAATSHPTMMSHNKRPMEYASPEYYFPKRPKTTAQWHTTTPHHHMTVASYTTPHY